MSHDEGAHLGGLEVALPHDAEADFVAELAARKIPAATKIDISDVSPGLGPSCVFKVSAINSVGRSETYFVKGPRADQGAGLGIDGETARDREIRVYESLGHIRLEGIVFPRTEVMMTDSARWLWMEDLSSTFQKPISSMEAGVALDRITELSRLWPSLRHAEERAQPDFLETHGWMLYEHHVDKAIENVDRLLAFDDSRILHISNDELMQLRALLTSSKSIDRLAGRLPQTLIHGDFHAKNARVTYDGELALLDFERVGVGPVGSDVAIYISLFEAFTGLTIEDEEELVVAFMHGLQRRGVRFTAADVRKGLAAWLTTWGLHLRLGPGLSYVLSVPEDRDVSGEVADISSGLRRALRYRDALE